MVAEVSVIAPLRNRSGVSRALTLGRSMSVKEVDLADGSLALAVDGTPVDCVRFATLGLLDATPDVVVSGINLGVNAGDDVGYSGTVGAAIEGLVLGWGAIAASQFLGGKWNGEMDTDVDFGPVARFVAGLVPLLGTPAVPAGTMLNVNGPRVPLKGAKVAALGARWYDDNLELEREDDDGRHYWIYGSAPRHQSGPDTDLAALDEGYITVTPIRYELTDTPALERLSAHGLPTVEIPEAT